MISSDYTSLVSDWVKPLADSRALLVASVLFALAALSGFPTVEHMRRLQLATAEKGRLVRFQDKWYIVLPLLAIPASIVLLTFSVEVPAKHRAWTALAMVLLQVVVQFAHLLPMPPVLFGVRGLLIAMLGFPVMYQNLQMADETPSVQGASCDTVANSTYHVFHFLSLASFFMAAWFCCGLGSFGGWVAHPEYGVQSGKVKRVLLSGIQVAFIAGFLFENLACIALYDKAHSQQSSLTEAIVA